MADALISAVVGGAGRAATLGLAGYSARHLKRAAEEVNMSLMGVGAAFVFTAQMINFTIPGTSGVVGAGLTLLIAGLIGLGVRRRFSAKS